MDDMYMAMKKEYGAYCQATLKSVRSTYNPGAGIKYVWS